MDFQGDTVQGGDFKLLVFFFRGPLNIEPLTAIGGGEVYTLRRSFVRIPIGTEAISCFSCQFCQLLA
jgi:hypothetical protein